MGDERKQEKTGIWQAIGRTAQMERLAGRAAGGHGLGAVLGGGQGLAWRRPGMDQAVAYRGRRRVWNSAGHVRSIDEKALEADQEPAKSKKESLGHARPARRLAALRNRAVAVPSFASEMGE